MKLPSLAKAMLLPCCFGLVQCGCTTEGHSLTSPYHPGPTVGEAIGNGVGVVAGNVAGVGVGAAEGLAVGAAAPFDNTRRIVRRWRTEVTPDGRTIQVPEDVLVDVNGRPVGLPTKK